MCVYIYMKSTVHCLICHLALCDVHIGLVVEVVKLRSKQSTYH